MMVKPDHDASGTSHQINEIYRFFEFSLDLFAISGFDGYLKRVNPAWERILGYTTEELLSRPILDFVHPDDRLSTLNQRQQTHTGASIVNFESRYVCKDNSIKWLEWTAHPYAEESVNYIVGRDITGRKLAELALQESENRFRTMADTAPVLIWLSGQDKGCYFFNQPWLTFRGRTMKQEMGMGWAEGVYADDFHHCLQIYTESFDKRQPFEMEYRLQRADGVYRWISDQAVPRFASDGLFLGYVGSCTDIHDRKLSLETVRQNARTLSEFIDAFPGLTVETDLDGNILTFNQQFANRYRTEGVELASQNIYDLMSPLSAEARKPYFQVVISSRQPLRFQDQSRGHFFDVTVFPILDADQQVVRLGSYIQDITELKQAELALRQSKHTVGDLLNGSPDIAFLVDIDDNLVTFNKNFLDQFDASEMELIGRPLADFLPPDFVGTRKSIVKRVLETREPVREEVEYFGQFFDYTVYPILNEAQEVSSLATFSKDITLRKQFEQKLLNSEQQFRKVLESAVQGIVLVNAFGKITLLNRYAEDQFGYETGELVGQMVEILIPDALRGFHQKHREGYLADPETRPMGTGMELMGRRKDGSVFPVEVSLSYMDNAGELLAMAFVSDISERKHMEQDRLDTQRMQLEVKQERDIIDLRQRFMAMVSHEFRTPLTIIASSTEMLQRYYDRLPRERQMEKFQIINGQVWTMVTLLDDILALNKIQAGSGDFFTEPLDLPALCNRILDNVKLVDRDQHQFIFAGDWMPPVVYADRRMIEHIINNLLSNAIKYSPADSSIHFLLSEQEDTIRMEVRDQGIGITPEDQKNLFEPFYRAHNAYSVNGTGLGLTIVKHYVDRHGGSIVCHSVEGQGASFIIYLPKIISQ